MFLPDAAGPVTTPKARALIAHELVHVAQQRVHGRVPDGAQGRRMEAEAVAVERRYETTTAAGPELHHPPAPAPAPELAGPAQLAPTYATAPPDPAHSHFDVPAREEIVQLAESSAHRVVEEWSNPATGGSGFRNPTSPAPAFDRATRRQELEAEMLDEINADRAATGEPLLSGLEPQHVERLERRLDHEEITGERRGGRSSGSRTPLPPLVGGAFGDTVSFTETIGGQQQQQAQQTPAQRNQQVQEALRQQEAQRQAQAQQQQQRTAPGRAGPRRSPGRRSTRTGGCPRPRAASWATPSPSPSAAAPTATRAANHRRTRRRTTGTAPSRSRSTSTGSTWRT
ncbi:hypothetical protein ACFQV2_27695 [Actinokineospora soli]|uniref:DUF4157 domain-containing protein n=1 Tax=Actinokineospora soli TaxID=1048753 RepID=A0ABW2TU75_9PSEU